MVIVYDFDKKCTMFRYPTATAFGLCLVYLGLENEAPVPPDDLSKISDGIGRLVTISETLANLLFDALRAGAHEGKSRHN